MQYTTFDSMMQAKLQQREQALREERQQEMAAQAQEFVANPTKGLAWDGKGVLWLSRILYWFADDLGGPPLATSAAIGALDDRDAKAALSAAVAKRRVEVKYFRYNWTLNRSS